MGYLYGSGNANCAYTSGSSDRVSLLSVLTDGQVMIRPEELTSNRVYDRCAATYGYDLNSILPIRLKYELVQRYVREDFNVLDVGCANGLHMQALARLCAQIVGIDINEPMLEIGAAKLRESGIANARLLKQSATSMEFPAECFDLAYSFSTLLLVPDTRVAIREIARVVKRGGLLILDITGRRNLSQWYWGRYYRRHGHFGVNSFTWEEVEGLLLGELGLELLEIHATGVLDQWKYVPLLRHLHFLDRITHARGNTDMDYRVSNKGLWTRLANRWYVVARKP
jgi:ubiquinone/menaquinone biosynthesis C-methylase UbiE